MNGKYFYKLLLFLKTPAKNELFIVGCNNIESCTVHVSRKTLRNSKHLNRRLTSFFSFSFL